MFVRNENCREWKMVEEEEEEQGGRVGWMQAQVGLWGVGDQNMSLLSWVNNR